MFLHLRRDSFLLMISFFRPGDCHSIVKILKVKNVVALSCRSNGCHGDGFKGN
ncbi:unnamed protein product [Tenebrio molitor]|nr:unnamed protein product [Tenebrio molitor]